MVIVLPVTIADYKLAYPLVKLINKLGGVGNHLLLLAFSDSCPRDARSQIIEEVPYAKVLDLMTKDERGWPRSCNSIFAELAETIEFNKGYGHTCWYMFEADNTPMCPRWADKLYDEYVAAHKPYMGVLHQSYKTRNGVRFEDGKHLVGTGIYPYNLSNYTTLHKFLNEWPWDVFMQWDIAPKAHHTELIQHLWISCNARKQGNSIVTSPVKGYEDRSLAGEIRPDAVVVHGLKDASLINILLEDDNDRANILPEPDIVPRKRKANARKVQRR